MGIDNTGNLLPVSSWINIPKPDESDSKVETSAEESYSDEKLLNLVSSNLSTLFQENVNYVDDLSDGDNIPLKVLSLMNRVRQLLDSSIVPAKIYQALERNKGIIDRATLPLQKDTCIHGLPIQHLDKARHSVLASEFYTGKKSGNRLPLRMYMSRIIADTQSMDIAEIVESTHTGIYGMQKGNVTLIFTRDEEFLGKLPTSRYMTPTPMSEAVALPVGTESTNISGCIVFNSEDEQKTIEAIKQFAFTIPVYNKEGKIIYPKQ